MQVAGTPRIIVTVDGKTWSQEQHCYLKLSRNRGACDLVWPHTRWGPSKTDKLWPNRAWLDGGELRLGCYLELGPHGQAVAAECVVLEQEGKRRTYTIQTGYILGALTTTGAFESVYVVLYRGHDGWHPKQVEPFASSYLNRNGRRVRGYE
ncbi:hypothetical protein YWS52_36680 [Chitiniphilus shinanonensis]